MCSNGHTKRKAAAQTFIDEGGCYEIFAQSPICFGDRSSQKSLFTGFKHQRWHKAGFHFINAINYRDHFCMQELQAHIFHHLVLFVEIFRCVGFKRIAFFD